MGLWEFVKLEASPQTLGASLREGEVSPATPQLSAGSKPRGPSAAWTACYLSDLDHGVGTLMSPTKAD